MTPVKPCGGDDTVLRLHPHHVDIRIVLERRQIEHREREAAVRLAEVTRQRHPQPAHQRPPARIALTAALSAWVNIHTSPE